MLGGFIINFSLLLRDLMVLEDYERWSKTSLKWNGWSPMKWSICCCACLDRELKMSWSISGGLFMFASCGLFGLKGIGDVLRIRNNTHPIVKWTLILVIFHNLTLFGKIGQTQLAYQILKGALFKWIGQTQKCFSWKVLFWKVVLTKMPFKISSFKKLGQIGS